MINLPARRLGSIIAFALAAVVLAACGKSAEIAPTAAPGSTTPLIDLTTVPTEIAASPPAIASPVSGEPTVGEIADRISAAWSGVQSYRATFITSVTVMSGSPVAVPVASPGASPAPSTVERTIVDEVVVTGQRHRTERIAGEIRSEIIYVNNVVYVRGIVLKEGTPGANPQSWTTLDPATLPADSPYRTLVEEITRTTSPPYAGLSQDERDRVAHPSGIVSVNGRECSVYKVADTTATGERIDVTFAIDELDLPCSIETQAGGVVGTTVFEFNVPLAIEPPV